MDKKIAFLISSQTLSNAGAVTGWRALDGVQYAPVGTEQCDP